MNENNFTELYKTWSTDKLLDIIDNPNDYQPLTVETAQFELASRKMSAEQLETAKAIQAGRQKQKADKQQKTKAVEEKIKSVGSSLIGTFNPIQQEPLTADKYIKLTSIFLGGLSIYQFYKEFGMLKFMFTDNSADWDFGMVLYFLPLFLVPTAGLLLWFRKKHGWTLSTLFFSYTATGAIPLFLSAINRQSEPNIALETIFPVVSPTVYVGSFFLFAGVTWMMTKENIRKIYNIDRQTMFLTICLGVMIIVLMTLAI